jgi:hypothetical protein
MAKPYVNFFILHLLEYKNILEKVRPLISYFIKTFLQTTVMLSMAIENPDNRRAGQKVD